MSVQSVNPATGEIIETFRETSAQEIERMLATVHAAFLEWRALSCATRAQPMRKAAEILKARRAEYARLMAPRWASRSSRPRRK